MRDPLERGEGESLGLQERGVSGARLVLGPQLLPGEVNSGERVGAVNVIH